MLSIINLSCSSFVTRNICTSLALTTRSSASMWSRLMCLYTHITMRKQYNYVHIQYMYRIYMSMHIQVHTLYLSMKQHNIVIELLGITYIRSYNYIVGIIFLQCIMNHTHTHLAYHSNIQMPFLKSLHSFILLNLASPSVYNK